MPVNTLDIGSKAAYPAKDLSNFAPHAFIFDEVECASLEGILQSFKFDKRHIQAEVCKLTGYQAKQRGKDRNNQWKAKGGLWWMDEFYPRKGEDYQRLLDRLYITVARQNEAFRKALLATGDLILTHHIGRSSESETILTQSEFCNRLMKLRNLSRKGTDCATVNCL